MVSCNSNAVPYWIMSSWVVVEQGSAFLLKPSVSSFKAFSDISITAGWIFIQLNSDINDIQQMKPTDIGYLLMFVPAPAIR